MDKRTFIKLLSAITASPVISPMLAWAVGDKLKNWAGNIDYSTENLYSASSIEQVCSFVTQHAKLKALGTRHCFNKIADSHDYFLSLKSMDDVISLDAKPHTLTLGAGITHGKLSPYLHATGSALHHLASLPHLSVPPSSTPTTHHTHAKH